MKIKFSEIFRNLVYKGICLKKSVLSNTTNEVKKQKVRKYEEGLKVLFWSQKIIHSKSKKFIPLSFQKKREAHFLTVTLVSIPKISR